MDELRAQRQAEAGLDRPAVRRRDRRQHQLLGANRQDDRGAGSDSRRGGQAKRRAGIQRHGRGIADDGRDLARQQVGGADEAVDEQGLRPVVDRVFPFTEARAALERLDRAEQLGKIVVEIAP